MGAKILYNKIAPSFKAVVIVLIILAIYNKEIAILANEAVRSELMSYILVVPFLFSYLVYRKRKML